MSSLTSLMEYLDTNQVQIIEVCQVTPSFECSTHQSVATEVSLPLTLFDLMWLKFPPVERIFFYKLTELTPTFFHSVILPKLKLSLSHALLHFLPLAGNLMWPPEATIPLIRYTPGDGVSLTVAESDAAFYRLSGCEVREAKESHPYIPQLPVTSSRASVIALKITLFPNQGFCIGISAHHAILDGKSSTMFMKAWAHMCNLDVKEKQQCPALPTELTPFLDRTVIRDPERLDLVYLNHWEEFKWPGSDLDPNPRSMKTLQAVTVMSSSVRTTVELSPQDIKNLRHMVICQLPKEDSDGQAKPIHLSTFVLTLAYTLVCLVKAKRLESSRTVLFGFTADCRARLDPPIHENYFGNCVDFFLEQIEAEALLKDNAFGHAAVRLSELIKSLEKGVLDGAKEKLAKALSIIAAAGAVLAIGVAGSTRFKVYETDFGWGKPEKVEVTSIDRTGAVSMAESKDGSGGIEVGLLLEKHETEIFKALFLDGLSLEETANVI